MAALDQGAVTGTPEELDRAYTGVRVPAGFDPATTHLPALAAGHELQYRVLQASTCAWIDVYARAASGAVRAEAAVRANAAAVPAGPRRDWVAEAALAVADAMAGGGPVRRMSRIAGCGEL